MKIISGKAAVKDLMSPIIDKCASMSDEAFVSALHAALLTKKIRFPTLEYAAKEILVAVPQKRQIPIADGIMKLQEIGGNTMVGMILQLRLSKHFKQSINKAVDYIIFGNEWYVCDIIGERVMGYALLTDPEKTVPVLKKFARHSDKWIVRSVGVATHFAIKKGLNAKYAEEMFELLISLSGATDFHTKKGVGWAAKTIAKFHPEIVAKYKARIDHDEQIKQWFKTKIKIGLSRSFKYASKYPG
jgi:hypothetical protein